MHRQLIAVLTEEGHACFILRNFLTYKCVSSCFIKALFILHVIEGFQFKSDISLDVAEECWVDSCYPLSYLF